MADGILSPIGRQRVVKKEGANALPEARGGLVKINSFTPEVKSGSGILVVFLKILNSVNVAPGEGGGGTRLTRRTVTVG